MMRLYHGTNMLFDAPDLVMANRLFRTQAADHNRDNRYDLVIGPIADDRMGVLFRRFEAGLVTLENLIEELKFKKVLIAVHVLSIL